jgi:hypothetical protein
MTRSTTIQLCILAVSGVLLLTSHNRTLTLVMAVLALFTVGWLITDQMLSAVGRRRDRREREAMRETPWRVFSEPTSERGQRRIGVERRTDDGVLLDRDTVNDVIVSEKDAIAKLDAQGDAMSRATEYNQEGVRIWPTNPGP